jgi:hypothetical protein
MQASQPPSPLFKILPFVPWAERVFIVATLIALVLKATGNTSTLLLAISMSGLALTFFLSAFLPIDIPFDENEKFEFIDLLALSIVPKVSWIGSAVMVVGILLNQLDLPSQQYLQMFMIGSSVVIGSVVILLISSSMGVKNIRYIIPIYFRAVPLLLMVAWLYFNS